MGARREVHREIAWRNRLRGWLRSHAYSLFSALGRILHRPLDQGLTIAVLAVALALPALGLVAVQNGAQLLAGAARPADLLLFLVEGASQELAADFADRLRGDPRVLAVEARSPEQALEEFRSLSGFADALAVAEGNPLPWVLSLNLAEPEQVEQLASSLRNQAEVDAVIYEGAWLTRLQGLLALFERALWVVGALLSVAVLLIVGNTVRLEIATRLEEIEVVKLIGGSDAFVRRPFLYGGLWLGMAAGIGALALVAIAMWFLHSPVETLALSYGSSLTLAGLSITQGLALIGCGMLLGWGGAWLASAQRLRAIDPR